MEHAEVRVVTKGSNWLDSNPSQDSRLLASFMEMMLAEGHTICLQTVGVQFDGTARWRFVAKVLEYGQAYDLGHSWRYPVTDDSIVVHIEKQKYLH